MQKNNSKKVAKVEVRIPPEVKECFAEKCEIQGKTVSETVRGFIHQHINSDNLNAENNKNTPIKKLSILSIAIISIVATTSLITNSQLFYDVPDPKIVNIFNKYDSDRNGFLTLSDFEEYKDYKISRILKGKSIVVNKLLSNEQSLSIVTAEEYNKKYNAIKRLAKYDLNVDGQVDLKEFLQSKPRLNYISWKSFHLLDTNQDTILSKQELLNYANEWFNGYPEAQKRAKLESNIRLWKLDDDKDGEISYEEFKQYKEN